VHQMEDSVIVFEEVQTLPINGRSTMGKVHVINLTGEYLKSVPEIETAAKMDDRLLDDLPKYPDRYQGDFCASRALDDYYGYYFFERQADRSSMISLAELGGDDTLLSPLADDRQTADNYNHKYRKGPPIHVRQAFATAANAFKVIDAPTEGIVVPFGADGRQLINDLCSAFEYLDRKYHSYEYGVVTTKSQIWIY